MDPSFRALAKEKRNTGLTLSNYGSVEECIIEHITDKWLEHIDFDGLIYFECIAESGRCIHSIERIEVQRIDIRRMINPKTLQNDYVMRLEVCCVCLTEGRKNCIRRQSWLEIDMRCLRKRFWEASARKMNVRVRPHIQPICIYASYNGCMHVQLKIGLEFIASQAGRICGLQKTRGNDFCSTALYPQLKCTGN